MILYIGVIINILLLGFGFWVISKGIEADRGLLVGLGSGLCITFAILTLAFTITAFDYTDYLINPEARIEAQVEKRIVYVTMLSEMGMLMEQDVTASETYMNIYNEVMKFNAAVRRYEKWGGTWLEGLSCDPTYEGLEIIPLN